MQPASLHTSGLILGEELGSEQCRDQTLKVRLALEDLLLVLRQRIVFFDQNKARAQ